jgi:hypothetical protein
MPSCTFPLPLSCCIYLLFIIKFTVGASPTVFSSKINKYYVVLPVLEVFHFPKHLVGMMLLDYCAEKATERASTNNKSNHFKRS